MFGNLLSLQLARTRVRAVPLQFSRKWREERAVEMQQSCAHSTLVAPGTFCQWPQMMKEEMLMPKA